MATQSMGRLVSKDPVESQFFSINAERVKSFTDLKINELRKIIESSSSFEKDFIVSFLSKVDKELDEKFLFDLSTRHLKENIKAPIIFAFYELLEHKA